MKHEIVNFFKDIAPIASVVSALFALLQDRFRIFPRLFAHYLFWYGAMCFYIIWSIDYLASNSAILGWSNAQFADKALVVLIASSLPIALMIVFILTGFVQISGRVINMRTVRIKQSSAYRSTVNLQREVLDDDIDRYWRLSDFCVLAKKKFSNPDTRTITSLRLVGGAILLDVSIP